jgi:hypothetical protein
MVGWDQYGPWAEWLGYGVDSPGSGYGPMAGCCERVDEPLVSCTTELVNPS